GSRRTAAARTASLRSAAAWSPRRRSTAPRSRGAAPRCSQLDGASWGRSRWRAPVDADHEGLDARREAWSRSLCRRVAAVGCRRRRGGDALLKTGAGGVRRVARGDGGGARRGAGRERRLERRLRRRLAGEAGVPTVLDARDVAVDASLRRGA